MKASIRPFSMLLILLQENKRSEPNTFHSHVLASNRTRRVDFALFMVHALTDDSLVQQVPAIVSCKSESALAHAGR